MIVNIIKKEMREKKKERKRERWNSVNISVGEWMWKRMEQAESERAKWRVDYGYFE